MNFDCLSVHGWRKGAPPKQRVDGLVITVGSEVAQRTELMLKLLRERLATGQPSKREARVLTALSRTFWPVDMAIKRVPGGYLFREWRPVFYFDSQEYWVFSGELSVARIKRLGPSGDDWFSSAVAALRTVVLAPLFFVAVRHSVKVLTSGSPHRGELEEAIDNLEVVLREESSFSHSRIEDISLLFDPMWEIYDSAEVDK